MSKPKVKIFSFNEEEKCSHDGLTSERDEIRARLSSELSNSNKQLESGDATMPQPANWPLRAFLNRFFSRPNFENGCGFIVKRPKARRKPEMQIRHSGKWIELVKMWRWEISPNKKECTLKPPRTSESTLHLLFFSIFSHTEEGLLVCWCCFLRPHQQLRRKRIDGFDVKSFLYLWTFSFSFSDDEELRWCASR